MNIIQVAAAGKDGYSTNRGRIDVRSARGVSKTCEKQTIHVQPTSQLFQSEEASDASSEISKKNRERVTINIAGTKFVTTWGSLAKLPNSRLGRLTVDDIDSGENDIFFERNPTLFPYILALYSTGQFSFPHNFCGASIVNEMEFWEISRCALSPCCKEILLEQETQQEENEAIAKQFSQLNLAEMAPDDKSCGWRVKLGRFLDDPKSSNGAKVWMFVYLFVTIVYYAADAVSTVKSFRTPMSNGSLITANLSDKERLYITTREHGVTECIRYITTIYYTLDIILRMLAARSFKLYFRSVLNIIDLIWVLTTWSLFASYMIMGSQLPHLSFLEFKILYFMSYASLALRIFRIYRFSLQYTPLKILVLTLKGSSTEICILLLLLCGGTMVFGSLIYISEISNDDSFMDNALIGYWWAVVTMTTVGYGDTYPKDAAGYLVGIVCVIVGVGFIGLPMSVISANYSKYRSFACTLEARNRCKLKYLKMAPTIPSTDSRKLPKSFKMSEK
ncbi:potassium voltage-gated channel protein Shaw-like [Lingula anatina]|uniref:Potassium voltage-gated channel protein Shaw-like n=1 Tax=Lingula anatina TaxID=7574 RepID=A0A1S3H5C8_LINAN|nr:potassium voltage-gated channel protein Shaw-like [Lingula anatina]|eukprot:XP_013380666.1 potassium voltage-gated channel protein Shaw-like [Lingula anatina]